jgi:hypothetical protein
MLIYPCHTIYELNIKQPAYLSTSKEKQSIFCLIFFAIPEKWPYKVIADQTFRVSAAGDFEPDGASEMLYDE